MRIIKTGILDSIQDAGRFGYQYLGINPSGAMDTFAMQVSNVLVGNDPGEAVIEMHFPAAVFMFTQPALIAMAGADFSPSINGEPVPTHHPIQVGRNDVLQFHKPIHGARTYLAVAGGMQIPDWMNSKSTNLKAKAGGVEGRRLLKDDLLILQQPFPLQPTPDNFTVLPWQAEIRPQPSSNNETATIIDILPGHEWNRLTDEARQFITAIPVEISQQSDRMGYRLNNIPLTTHSKEEIISTAVGFGTIQLLPDGKLIILMADHQTTGGYPRIAHVITANHSILAQLKAGDKIQFRLTSQEQAENLLISQQQYIQQLRHACQFRLQEYIHKSTK